MEFDNPMPHGRRELQLHACFICLGISLAMYFDLGQSEIRLIGVSFLQERFEL